MKYLMIALLFLLAFSSSAQRNFSRPGEDYIGQYVEWKLCHTDGGDFTCGDCSTDKEALTQVANAYNKVSEKEWVVVPCDSDLAAMKPAEERTQFRQEFFFGGGGFSTTVGDLDTRQTGLNFEAGVTIFNKARELFVEPSIQYNSVYSVEYGTLRFATPSIILGGYAADFLGLGLGGHFFYHDSYQTFGVSGNTLIRLVAFKNFNIDLRATVGTSNFNGFIIGGAIRGSYRIP